MAGRFTGVSWPSGIPGLYLTVSLLCLPHPTIFFVFFKGCVNALKVGTAAKQLGGDLISVCTSSIAVPVPDLSSPTVSHSSFYSSFLAAVDKLEVVSPVVDLTVRDGNGTVVVVEDLEDVPSCSLSFPCLKYNMRLLFSRTTVLSSTSSLLRWVILF